MNAMKIKSVSVRSKQSKLVKFSNLLNLRQFLNISTERKMFTNMEAIDKTTRKVPAVCRSDIISLSSFSSSFSISNVPDGAVMVLRSIGGSGEVEFVNMSSSSGRIFIRLARTF
jgi:hypothetical protein